ncbi:TRAP transporter small permease [Desulfobacter latus]|uniref:TRAP transporter small permease n=1 Tax=Desulfobacter latus TaxID=2292 RepID=A0A850T6Q9_9BACT|nr:TRAP transporter small permease [Desulfobacter latus]NWH04048.1 TRAP transporter small permease [Desulfobacter latus]
MEIIEKISEILNRCAGIIAGTILVFMILLTMSNIVLRRVWVPIRGTYEIMGFAGAVITALAMGFTQKRREHIHVDILVSRFPRSVKRAVFAVNNGLCTLFFLVAAWFVCRRGITLLETGEVSETLRMVYYPFAFVVAFGCFLLAAMLFIDLLKLFFQKDFK